MVPCFLKTRKNSSSPARLTGRSGCPPTSRKTFRSAWTSTCRRRWTATTPAPPCFTSTSASSDGKGSKRLSMFNELLARLRAAVPDMILQVGGSISFAPEGDGEVAKWLSATTPATCWPTSNPQAGPGDDRRQHQSDERRRADVRGRPRRHIAGRAGQLPRLPRNDHSRRSGMGSGAYPPPERQRHPDPFPARQHHADRDGGTDDAPRRLQRAADFDLGGDRRRLRRPEYLQSRQFRPGLSGWVGADGRNLDAATCCRST